MAKSSLKFVTLISGVVPLAFLPAMAVTDATARNSASQFVPGSDSYRVSFELKSPRRFATRFIREKRTLQIRVVPAKASEFEASRFYDTKYVRRVLIEEQNGDVIVSLQLKDFNLGWLVTSQENPWRILVDLWRTAPSKNKSLDEEWNWQEGQFNLASTAPHSVDTTKPSSQSIQPIQTTPVVDVPSVASEPVDAATPQSGVPVDRILSNAAFPENFGRLDTPVKTSGERLAELQKKAGMVLGSAIEYQAASALAEELYKTDQIAGAVTLYRRMAALSEAQFKENPRTMWLAGESAYLAKNFDLSTDYLRALLLRHGQSEFASLAKLRLNDIALLQKSANPNNVIDEKISSSYAEIALAETSAWEARIAATMRLLHNDNNFNYDAAKLYQQNLNACVNRSLLPFDMRKNCAYIQTRSAVEKSDILSADAEIQRFRRMAPNDSRIARLEENVQKNIRSLLADVNERKTWDSWIAFEKKARPELLDFTLKDPDMMFARAESWEAAGEPKKAAQLYAVHWQLAQDERKKDETAAVTARLFYKSNDYSKADTYLRRLETSDYRRGNGLGDRAVGAMREIALPPYRNKRALRILMDEITAGRYVEHSLSALVNFAQMQKGTGAADTLHEKILAHPPKDQDEANTVETVTLQYADDLRNSNRNARAADMYHAVANTNKSGRRAEAAYKAGLAYARAGQLEKAKTSWQMAASDVNDKRYASLAAERLERLK